MIPGGILSVIGLGVLLLLVSFGFLITGEFLTTKFSPNGTLMGSLFYAIGQWMLQISPFLMAISFFFLSFIIFGLIFLAPSWIEDVASPTGVSEYVLKILPPLLGWLVCRAFMTPEGIMVPLSLFGSFLQSHFSEGMDPETIKFLMGILGIQAYFVSLGISVISVAYAMKFIAALGEGWSSSPSIRERGRLVGAVFGVILSSLLIANLSTVVTMLMPTFNFSPSSVLASIQKYWEAGVSAAGGITGGG